MTVFGFQKHFSSTADATVTLLQNNTYQNFAQPIFFTIKYILAPLHHFKPQLLLIFDSILKAATNIDNNY